MHLELTSCVQRPIFLLLPFYIILLYLINHILFVLSTVFPLSWSKILILDFVQDIVLWLSTRRKLINLAH